MAGASSIGSQGAVLGAPAQVGNPALLPQGQVPNGSMPGGVFQGVPAAQGGPVGQVNWSGLLEASVQPNDPKAPSVATTTGRALSGSEFLDTLGGVQGLLNSGVPGASGKQGASSGGFAGGFGGSEDSASGFAEAKPDLKLLQGGLGANTKNAQGAGLFGGAKTAVGVSALAGQQASGKPKGGLTEDGSSDGQALGMLAGSSASGMSSSGMSNLVSSNGTLNEVTGHVVKGALAQDRLSSESLNGVSTNIRNLSMQGGGEMRIRLHPENLGELHVRVMTQGNEVALKIQASDERSKKILESSMGNLKEGLAAQSLILSKYDLSVGGGSTANGQGSQDGAFSGAFQSRQESFQGNMQGNSQSFGDQPEFREDRRLMSPQARSAFLSTPISTGRRMAQASGAGRVDVMA